MCVSLGSFCWCFFDSFACVYPFCVLLYMHPFLELLHSFASECIHLFRLWLNNNRDPHLLELCSISIHEIDARPLGINLMIYNCWNYEWTMNCNLSSLNVYAKRNEKPSNKFQTIREWDAFRSFGGKVSTRYFTFYSVYVLKKKQHIFHYNFSLFSVSLSFSTIP